MADDGIITFPKDFLWGASTSSYQVEGGNRSSALWDWEERKGWERSGEAAGSWERFDDDLALLKSLHLNSYRFSLEWSRVEPEPGRFDEAVLSRYAAWARKLREAGIRPFVCFHHFSEPAWLLRNHPNGWLDVKVVDAFLAYVEKAASALAERVSDWIVFNEPMVFLIGAYGMGHFPPGRRMLWNPRKEFLPILVPHLCEAHGHAYELLHRLQPSANVGVAHHVGALDAARPGDEEAVRTWDWFMHRSFLEQTKDHLDFLGINYYTRIFVGRSRLPFAPLGVVPGYAELEERITRPLFRLAGGRRGDRPRTGMGWEYVPDGLGRVVSDLWQAYGKPIYITENGMAAATGVDRSRFIREHLVFLREAMGRGADVRGYFHWSLVDNYEWGSYRPRFGLFSRDRKPSDGAALYGEIARTGVLPHG